MKKRIISVVLALVLVLTLLTSCANNSAELKVGVLKGPTGFGAIKLIDDANEKKTKNAYEVTIDTAPDAVTSALLSGEIDIAFLPSNAAAMLYNKSKGEVKSVAVATLGILYVVSRDASIKTLDDLKGKDIITSGAGSTAEYATNYILSSNDLAIGEDLQLEYATEHSEAAAKLLAGDYDVAILPQPFVTSVCMQDNSLQPVIDLNTEWDKLSDGKLCMTAVTVRKEVLEKNPKAIDTFLAEFAESAKYCVENPEEAAQLIEKYDIMKAPAAKNAIPKCNIVCVTGEEMVNDLNTVYDVLYNANPKSIGGAMPNDDFYYRSK